MRLAMALGLRKSDFPMTPVRSWFWSRFCSRSGPAPAPAPSGNGGGALEADPGGAAHARCGRADLQRGCGGGAAMFARGAAVALVQPQWVQVRNMATLKDITRRLKSIKNIQKITKSMKMVSAAKYARAERELKPARIYGTGALSLYEKAEIKPPEDKKKHLLIGVSSDRGLCGAIHTSIAKTLKNEITNLSNAGKEVMVVGVGDKIRGLLQRTHGNYFLLTFKEVGRRPPSFGDASAIALELLNSGYEFDEGSVIYNRFRSVISYKTDEKPIFSFETVAGSESLSIYDDLDADVLRNYQEFTLANILYYSLKESTTSEQSARMTAMDNASKNASEMIDKLTLTFNRTRQAVITKELIEIISGAAALD
uniref:ATP synthase F(1) complex subunit gamma, mitochondrial n=4 Tax=Taeniopygia guttata TaxID=59729 RepID=A0A674GC20_TAEGU